MVDSSWENIEKKCAVRVGSRGRAMKLDRSQYRGGETFKHLHYTHAVRDGPHVEGTQVKGQG